MSREVHSCIVCGSNFGTELHHRVFKSQVKPLENCKLNHVYLCPEHHRGTQGIHGKCGYKLDKLLKLQLQNNLEILFTKEYLTKEEVNEVLQISEKALNSLFKTIQSKGNKYTREDCIRSIMGGKVQIE